MPAPKGNKNRQQGLFAKTEFLQIRTTKEVKELLKNHTADTGEPMSELLERLIVAHFKK